MGYQMRYQSAFPMAYRPQERALLSGFCPDCPAPNSWATLPCKSTGRPVQRLGSPDSRALRSGHWRFVSSLAQVRKSERGTRIVKMVEVDRNCAKSSAKDGEVVAEDGKKALVLKSYAVFNASQIDGLAPMPERQTDIQPAEAVEAIIFGLQEEAGGRLKLNFGGNQPAYYPRTDKIRIPPASDFLSVEDFHATLLHEAIHGTGHPKRLARLHLDSRMECGAGQRGIGG